MYRFSKFPAIAASCAVIIGMVLTLSGFTATTTNPDQAEIVTTDVTHFWQAFDDAAKLPAAKRAAVYQKEYFDRASRGLKDFVAARRVTVEKFTHHIEKHRAYYEKIRPYIGKVVDQKPVIAAAFHKLKVLYPDIKFPRHVYFIVGPQRSAGINAADGIILSAEMFATPPGTPYSYRKIYPGQVPFVVVHETIHFNQTFQSEDKATLLQVAVTEGTANFIASLVLPMPDVRQFTDHWKYGCAHEAALAARFAAHADSTALGPWLYNHHPKTGWPPDMGYWMGYRMDQTLYDHAKDKRDALRRMLQVTDFKAFLKASGYPKNRPSCLPEKPVQGLASESRAKGKI